MSNLKNLKLEELKKMASQMNIKGRSSMNKEELLKVVKKNIKKGGIPPTELKIITKGRRQDMYPWENHNINIAYDPNEERQILEELGRIIGLRKVADTYELFTQKGNKKYLVSVRKGNNIDISSSGGNVLLIEDNISNKTHPIGYVGFEIIKTPSLLRTMGSMVGIRKPLKHNLNSLEYNYINNQGQPRRGQIVTTIPEDIYDELFVRHLSPVPALAPVVAPVLGQAMAPVVAPALPFNLSRHSTFLASNSNEVLQNNRNGNSCAICMEKLSAKHPTNPNGSNNTSTSFSGVSKLRCGHKFHKECMEDLTQRGGRECPLCRARINI